MKKDKNVSLICPECKSKETEYDYDKRKGKLIIKCKKCGAIISSQELEDNQPQKKRIIFDRKTKMVLVCLVFAVLLGMLIGETVSNIINYYNNYASVISL